MQALGTPDRDVVWGFDDNFRAAVLRRDPTFHSIRAPRVFARIIELLKILHAGMQVPELDPEREEADLKMKGVEDKNIIAALLATAKAERAARKQNELSPPATKRLYWYLYQFAWVCRQVEWVLHARSYRVAEFALFWQEQLGMIVIFVRIQMPGL